jgi:glutathione peroxidase-family protein
MILSGGPVLCDTAHFHAVLIVVSVCHSTTEIGMLQKLMEEFEARNIAVILVGNDSGMSYP